MPAGRRWTTSSSRAGATACGSRSPRRSIARADLAGGNREAVEAAADPANHLRPIAVVSARVPGTAAGTVASAETAGVAGYLLEGAVWPFPTPESVREVLRAVAPTGKPLLVPLSGVGPAFGTGEATAIGAATADLGIAVILLGAHYTHIADDLRAAVRYEHLHLETSSLAHWRGVATAVASIGAERLLLGTGSPRRPGASAIDAVLLARIPDDAKRAILAGNACRLFGLPDGPVDVTPPRLPARSWDVHTHHAPLPFDVPHVADDELVGELLTGPTSRAVASSAVAIFAAPAAGNEQAVRAASAGGPLGYVVADPNDLAFTEDQLRRHLDRPGMVGVKIHGEWSGVPTSSPRMAAAVRPPRAVRAPREAPRRGRRLGRRAARDRAAPSAAAHRHRTRGSGHAQRPRRRAGGADRQPLSRAVQLVRVAA